MAKPMSGRRPMIDGNHSSLSMVKQCSLLGLHRSGLSHKPCSESQEDLIILRLLDEQYFKTPSYGARKLAVLLKEQGYKINRKRAKRLMEPMGWRTLCRHKNTSEPDKHNRPYPYTLKGLRLERLNQVWAMGIAYVPMRKGFMCLCAIIDLRARYVANWGLSNTMAAEWCRQVVEGSLDAHGCPEILNTDQGPQFASEVLTGLLKENNAQISMDGKGRAIDKIFIERLWRSVKHEHAYLHVAEDGDQLYEGLQEYFSFYDHERSHQSLGYETPAGCYQKMKAA